MAGKSQSRAKTSKGKRAKRAKPRRSKNTLKRKVLKIINSEAETKQAYTELQPTQFNSGISGTGDILQIIPNIGVGSGEAQRIGNEVEMWKLQVKGAIVYSPSTGQYGTFANARLAARVFIVQPRMYSNIDAIVSNATLWQSQLLRKGLTQVGFTGVMNDLWAPINTDAIIKYYDKVHYLTGPYVASAVGSVQMIGSTKTFSWTKRFKTGKKLRFDPDFTSGFQPTNYCPVLMIGYVHMDGSAPDTLTTAINVQFDSTLSFKDL